VGRRQIGALAATAALALAGAATAQAGTQAKLVVREVSSAGQVRARFDLVGLHWRGAGKVRFRTRSVRGRWSAWRIADVDEHVNSRSAEATRTRGWRVGEPYWVGPSDRVEWRGTGEVRRVRAHFVSSPAVGVPPRTLDLAGSPRVVMRSAWGADEELRRAAPRYAPRVRFAIVHHTAGTNVYYPEDSAAIVRAIAVYHVQGNGWNDVGYNFLVDKYGQVFEGRYGGIARNVVGAHSAGFNTGSVGVAVMGTYGSRSISPAARAALVRLLAWRLDVAHVDPVSTVTWASGGNSRYPAGTPVTLAAVSGHRDTALTECPGRLLFAALPSIASSAAQAGLPKLYDVAVRGKPGGLVSFSGRLSSPQPWTISVRDSAGAPVAASSGTGSDVRWAWDARGVQGSGYAWRIEAPSVRPAKGTLGGAPSPVPPGPLPPVLSEFAFSPAALSPDGDGFADFATVTYRLRRSALVTARVLGEAASSAPVTLFQDQRQSARLQSWVWTADSVPDGRYVFEISARGGEGTVATVTAQVLVDRTLGFLRAEPLAFSPNGDGKDDTITFSFDLGATAAVKVQVIQYGREIAVVYSGELQPGSQRFVWNGQAPTGMVSPGQYDLVVTALDSLTESMQRLRFTVT
jgi:N-acetylmuramoyl-L-alanine amidase-like protein